MALGVWQPWLFAAAMALVVWILVAVVFRENRSNRHRVQLMKAASFPISESGWLLVNEFNRLVEDYFDKNLAAMYAATSVDDIRRTHDEQLDAVQTAYRDKLHHKVEIILRSLASYGVFDPTLEPYLERAGGRFDAMNMVRIALPSLLRIFDKLDYE